MRLFDTDTHFLIRISPEQRDMIVAALGEYAYPACFEANDREELDLLVVMLRAAEDKSILSDAERFTMQDREIKAVREALTTANDAIAEYLRYLDGGEMRGSYDGKPERDGLRRASYAARAALRGNGESK